MMDLVIEVNYNFIFVNGFDIVGLYRIIVGKGFTEWRNKLRKEFWMMKLYGTK